ncbi:MAG: hypothetical protein ACRD4O_06460 [Bryobacteraceae bacterium]
MTPDERIEALTERVNALTQSVELLVQMHRDNEQHYEERFARIETLLEKHSEQMEKIVGIQEMLATILNGHEKRLRGIEGREQ